MQRPTAPFQRLVEEPEGSTAVPMAAVAPGDEKSSWNVNAYLSKPPVDVALEATWREQREKARTRYDAIIKKTKFPL